MPTSVRVRLATGIALLGVALALPSTGVIAGSYPTNTCVSKKMKAAATKCKSILKAWSKWEKDPSRDPGNAHLDGALARASARFSALWASSEDAALRKGVDCSVTTATSADVEAVIDSAVDNLVTQINADIDPMNPQNKSDLICRAKILKAAATKCGALLKAESTLIKKLEKDPQRTHLSQAKTAASSKFDAAWTAAACNTTATVGSIEGIIDGLSDSVVLSTTVSPSVPTSWQSIPYPAGTKITYKKKTLKPICSHGTDYQIFVKRGTVNKLLVYFQGGGACWDSSSCSLGTFKPSTGPGDDPSGYTNGFGDLNNPLNPFKDWNAVFIPYCTGDVHWGDAVTYYNPGPNVTLIYHKGFVNAQVAEKWAREHFVNPTDVFVTGSSAGAYGAIMGGIYLHKVYPASRISIVGDAGNGVITEDFLTGNIPGGRAWGIKNWGVEKNLPRWIPGLDVSIEALSIADLWMQAANFYPNSKFGQYSTAWDGSGGGQVAFYNVMLNPNNIFAWADWWVPTCEWHNTMVSYVNATAAGAVNGNYRYYIGAGSRHTMWGSDKVYADTTGGVPTIVDWISDMISNPPGPNWIDAECSTCNLVNTCQGGSNAGLGCAGDSDCPGGSCEFDPAPDPLAAPYGPGGTVTCP